jgi:hypothetical protein
LIEKQPGGNSASAARENWWCTSSDPNSEERKLIEI